MPPEIEIPLGFRLNLDHDVLVPEKSINIDNRPSPNPIYVE